MFVDRAVVTFIAGRGGNGCVSFRREKFVPRGGPDGGDGGDGGSIILVSQRGKNSLEDFKFRQLIKAESGSHGSGSNKTGKNGRDEIVVLPMGTVIKTYPDEKIMKDLSAEEEKFTIARGGKGGRGNVRFKSSVNQAPKRAEPGQKGETIKVVLELKLMAFAGLVGLPNAGKSTLISKVSGARPKIADYPFTTLHPHLGVVYQGYDSLVIADIPGIIEGAHKGEGMGLDFLRHIERNTVLVFLIDLADRLKSTPLETLAVLQNELKSYKGDLMKKKFFVVGNKMDLLNEAGRKKCETLQAYCRKQNVSYQEISALKGTNLEAFKNRLFEYYHCHEQ
jgi:GTP-binding protein